MRVRGVLLGGAAITLAAVAAVAHSAVVTFNGGPSTSWADGSFSYDLSGEVPDGFYYISPTSAYNGYGQNGESIFWNTPTTLNSLQLSKCLFCYDSGPTSFTASLYNAVSTLLASQTIVGPTDSFQTLVFDTPGVSQLTLTFTGGSDAYGDGRIVAWYDVANVSYAGVPEPATWAVLLLGLGGLGVALRSRRRTNGAVAVA